LRSSLSYAGAGDPAVTMATSKVKERGEGREERQHFLVHVGHVSNQTVKSVPPKRASVVATEKGKETFAHLVPEAVVDPLKGLCL